MSHKRLETVLRRSWIGYVAIGLAFVVAVVPASFAQESRVLHHGKSAGTGVEAEEPQTHDDLSDGLRSEAPEHTGVFVAAPIGKVMVGPEFVDGEPSYLRRIAVKGGITIVEISTTPFMTDLRSNQETFGGSGLFGKPDEQPASW